MRTFEQQRNYERLEQLPPQFRQLAVLSVRNCWEFLSNLWQSASKEPRVRQKIDNCGHVYWEAYDPMHDLTLCFDDEQAVMVWLDKQLYRQPRANLWNL